ncbi:MAG: methyltransferase, TrmH family [Actinomycetota bacterium]|nr:methyltransferase, TrmH family [Actinomycetota bacterium]
MLTNIGSDRVRSVRALSRRAVRDRERLFLAEGPQAVAEVVAHRPDTVQDLYFEAQGDRQSGIRQATVLAEAKADGLALREVSHEVLVAMSDALVPQGMLAVCRPVDVDLGSVLDASPRLLVILTNVRDPGNAGTVIRGADAAGADAVLFSDSSVEIYNPKVVRSTAGSLFHLPIVTGLPIAGLMDRVRSAGLDLLAADGSGDAILGEMPGGPQSQPDLSRPHAWVMGNEAWGLEPDVMAACDGVVRVPLYGKAESLNLAMAATLCLYQSASVQKRSGIR